MISVTNTYLDHLPGEEFFTSALQYPVTFTLGKKTIKQGRLIIFKKVHYYIQITLLTSKNVQETFDIPIPFSTEYHPEDNLMYFDYRLKSLAGTDRHMEKRLTLQSTKQTPSQYYDKILEIFVQLP